MSREEMAEVYGDEFMDNFDEEFEIPPEDLPVPFRYKLTMFLRELLANKAIWYVAGFVDAIIIGILFFK
jgi:hypothetical protein